MPDFGKSSSFYFTPRNHIIKIGKMVCEAAVEFCFLRFCQRWRGAATNDAVPDGLNQFNLLVNTEYSCLL
ncbi:MAG: hypothetical protein A3G18_07460 [Rhodospirillales bacterium RIFCSPLOWO2_12_FULL_58_28]|nr:MAG: hypothetical protein A3H92_08930 [Rhodospirillales bacterium RIFCSPLOWO2_02_FULL_58_16]OHC77562.1 MAG: hypothetical protein A3G18_07460 [Rhodospirillales bacterium RIFCSPLOWO2_12_FULL_58_28]